ncbi:MAG: HAMP domain-containing protein [Candidatus Omnitrophota bacterium]
MRIRNSILMKLIFLVALVELFIMLIYEYFAPLRSLIEKYAFLGPIIDISILILIITIIYLRLLKKPLDEFLKVMNAVEKRDFSVKANEERKDEFGFIAVHFNKMAEKLKNWGTDLEQEIQARTKEINASNEKLEAANEELRQADKELNVLNEGLEKKVEERTREITEAKQVLEKKAADLERFNKLSVDRELKMKELKEVISQLEQKLKEKS